MIVTTFPRAELDNILVEGHIAKKLNQAFEKGENKEYIGHEIVWLILGAMVLFKR